MGYGFLFLFGVKRMKHVLIISLLLGLSACSTEAWRVSTQESAKNDCLKAPIGEQQRCLDKLKETPR
jgi:hypothetical protein